MGDASPKKPLLLYDGECDFCKKWVGRWKKITKDRVEYRAYQEEHVSEANVCHACGEAVRLVMPDGKVYQAAEAIYRLLALSGNKTPLWLYEHIPGFARISEVVYRFVASRRRGFFSSFGAFAFFGFLGTGGGEMSYSLSIWFFLKILGVIYLIAFASFGVQAMGLIGSQGILPIQNFMDHARNVFGGKSFNRLPAIFWFSASDGMVRAVIWLGILASLLLIAGVFPRAMLIALFFLYLSLAHGGQVFMSFQWDILLLETGFLAIFLSPAVPLSMYVFWWLLFRLMFLSGAVKLLSGDSSWRDLTALTYHYETQPLPTIFAWFAHKLPLWFQKFSVLIMYGIELILPFFLFFSRPFRLFAGCAIALLEVLIFLTGNYTFFNLLTASFVLLLFDNQFWMYILPAGFFEKVSSGIAAFGVGWPVPPLSLSIPFEPIRLLVLAICGAYIFLSAFQLLFVFSRTSISRPLLDKVFSAIQPFHIINHYGLFAVMTKNRPEIIFEGSRDGEHWRPYEFRYKPGDLSRAPRWVQPHQPRLDWQMWFAALGKYNQNPWLVNLAVRLLQGSKPVIGLLKQNPFPESPPKFIRALEYDYHFITYEERKKSGNWWKRELKGEYLPVISLQQ